MVSVHRFNSVQALTVAGVAIALAGCPAPQATAPDQAESPAVAEVAAADKTKIPPAGKVIISGSSTVYPISEATVRKFKETKDGQKTDVSVEFTGTSAGFRKFCAGEVDLTGASRPILVKEIESCNQAGIRFIELPVAFDALTLAVNPKNNWIDSITVDELKKIWEPAAQNKITNWKQIRPGFPDKPLKLTGAGSDSGTFDYFNEVISGKPKESRMDYFGSEDDEEIVEFIVKEEGSLGYVPFSYFEANENRLKALAIDYGKGPVLPNRENVEKAKYQPFSRPLFIYVNVSAAQQKPEVRAFVEYYLKNAKDTVKEVQYIPLPDDGYRLASIQFQRGEVGTVFDGVPQPEVTIEELLRRQAVFQLNADQSRPGVARQPASN